MRAAPAPTWARARRTGSRYPTAAAPTLGGGGIGGAGAAPGGGWFHASDGAEGGSGGGTGGRRYRGGTSEPESVTTARRYSGGPQRATFPRGRTGQRALLDRFDARDVARGPLHDGAVLHEQLDDPRPRDRTRRRRFEQSLFEDQRLAFSAHVAHGADERLARQSLGFVQHVQLPRRDHVPLHVDRVEPPVTDRLAHVHDPHVVEHADRRRVVQVTLAVEVVVARRRGPDVAVALALELRRSALTPT